MVDMKQMAANTVLASDLPHARRAGDEPRVAPGASVAGVVGSGAGVVNDAGAAARFSNEPGRAHAGKGCGRGMLLIISGPSGVGKTTITRAVEAAIPDAVFSVSCTTRPRTSADREGVDYHFIGDAAFDQMIAAGDFLEHAGVFGKRYGTPRSWVEEKLSLGKLVILEIDVQGAMSVKRQMPEAFALFVLPPSEDTLLQRLRARARESEEVIQRRFAKAREEIATAQTCGVYDVLLVNRLLNDAVAIAVAVVGLMRGRKAGAVEK